MLIWFFLALGAAITNSWTQAIQKWAVFASRYSKVTITLIAAFTASLILFFISYLVGFPEIESGFWLAVSITAILNIFAFPIMLRAYELGEFSSVYSMILTTPIFLMATSFVFLGEVPSIFGILGVMLTVFGLWIITISNHEHIKVPNFSKGNLLGLLVALIWSISVNFDKLATSYSNVFFAPAVCSGIMSVGYAAYLFIKHKSLLVKNSELPAINNNFGFAMPSILIFLALGVVMALSNILHNSALLAGLASYTIAIKRTGVLFGVFWGWIFFKEKNILKKILGALVAVAGVIVILFT